MDTEFARKATDIVGLYLHPPENAVVGCVDEKPHIQVLDRGQGLAAITQRKGTKLKGFSHCYKRRGTTTLFAALEVATARCKRGIVPDPDGGSFSIS